MSSFMLLLGDLRGDLASIEVVPSDDLRGDLGCIDVPSDESL